MLFKKGQAICFILNWIYRHYMYRTSCYLIYRTWMGRRGPFDPICFIYLRFLINHEVFYSFSLSESVKVWIILLKEKYYQKYLLTSVLIFVLPRTVCNFIKSVVHIISSHRFFVPLPFFSRDQVSSKNFYRVSLNRLIFFFSTLFYFLLLLLLLFIYFFIAYLFFVNNIMLAKTHYYFLFIVMNQHKFVNNISQ